MSSTSNQIPTSLSQSDLAALTRILRSLDVVLTVGQSIAAPVHLNDCQDAVLLAKRLKQARYQRAANFDRELFGEPAWDMMLALYIAEGEGYRLKVSDLCEESGVPATTALRWIDRLMDCGFARKIPNPIDARSTFIECTDDLRTRLTLYLQGALDRQLRPQPIIRQAKD